MNLFLNTFDLATAAPSTHLHAHPASDNDWRAEGFEILLPRQSGRQSAVRYSPL
nr:hypothetical protein JVH1_7023 [Rhodococcus sp. JVH1]